jgi:hypothetical protein
MNLGRQHLSNYTLSDSKIIKNDDPHQNASGSLGCSNGVVISQNEQFFDPNRSQCRVVAVDGVDKTSTKVLPHRDDGGLDLKKPQS